MDNTDFSIGHILLPGWLILAVVFVLAAAFVAWRGWATRYTIRLVVLTLLVFSGLFYFPGF